MPTDNSGLRFRLNEPLVASQEIEGETILIHFDSGHYFSVNASGSLILAWIQQGMTVDDVANALAASYRLGPNNASAEVNAFLDTLLAEGLVVRNGASDGSSHALPSAVSAAFEKPMLQKFEDLQDLLMLDPIHDVDQAGWPLPADADAARPA